MIDDSKLQFNQSDILILNEYNVMELIDYCTITGMPNIARIKEVESLVIQLLLQLCLRLRGKQSTSMDDMGFDSQNRQWTRNKTVLESLYTLSNGRLQIDYESVNSDKLKVRLVI